MHVQHVLYQHVLTRNFKRKQLDITFPNLFLHTALGSYQTCVYNFDICCNSRALSSHLSLTICFQAGLASQQLQNLQKRMKEGNLLVG